MTKREKNTADSSRALFNRMLRDVAGPLERTLATLHWRGYLAMKVDETLFLSIGSTAHDLLTLDKFVRVSDIHEPDRLFRASHTGNYRHRGFDRRRFEMLLRSANADGRPRPSPRYACARVATTDNTETLYRLFATQPQHIGFCDAWAFNGPLRPGWSSFRKLRYGVKVPVSVLDAGVALLVKLMPVLGLHTIMSCDGHTTEPPVIHFFSRYHHQWARVALPQFLPPDDPFVKQWRFVESGWGVFRYQWRLAPTGCGDNVEAQYGLHANIQRLCRALMDSHFDGDGQYSPDDGLAARARFCKQSMTGPWDLNRPLSYTFSKDHAGGFPLPPLECEDA